MLGLHCSAGFSPAAESGAYSLVAARGLLMVVVSLVVEHRLQGAQASVASAVLSSARVDRVREGWYADALARRWDLRSNSCADLHALLFSTR